MEKKLSELVNVLKEKLGENYEVSFTESQKPGGINRGILIKKKGASIGAVVYPEVFLKTESDIDTVAEKIIFSHMNEPYEKEQLAQRAEEISSAWDNAKACLVKCVCKKEENLVFLEDKIWYEYFDLAVFFKLVFCFEEYVFSCPVKKDYMDYWNVSLDEMKQVADENRSEEDIVLTCPSYFGTKESAFIEERKNNFSILRFIPMALSYKKSQNCFDDSYGGNLIERPQILSQIADGVGCDLLITPASRDVLILLALPNGLSRTDYEYRSAEVAEVNIKDLIAVGRRDMVMSDHVYIFSYEKGAILTEEELESYLK